MYIGHFHRIIMKQFPNNEASELSLTDGQEVKVQQIMVNQQP